MEFSKSTIGVATAILGFLGGAAFKNTVDAYFGYEKLTLDQHKHLLDIFKFHNDIRKSDKSGLATKYVIVMGETKVLPPEVATKLADLLAEDTPGAEAKAAVAAAVAASRPAAPVGNPPTGAVSGRMFVQISSEGQRGLYDTVRQSVAAQFANLSLPAVEVRDDYSGATELRYFLPDDEELAKQVLAQVRLKLSSVRCARVRGYEKKGVRPGLLELWIGPRAAAGTDSTQTSCVS